MIKTIIFDVHKVISDFDLNLLFTNFALRIGISPEFLIEYKRANKANLLLGNLVLEQYFKDMKSAGANPDLDLRSVWIDEALKLRTVNSELLNIIDDLRNRYTVGTLTNVSYTRLISDERLGLYSHFDYAVLSCVEHLKKPDPEFYKLALSRANVLPEEAVFIDDNAGHVTAAVFLGIIGIVYKNNKQLFVDLASAGVKL